MAPSIRSTTCRPNGVHFMAAARTIYTLIVPKGNPLLSVQLRSPFWLPRFLPFLRLCTTNKMTVLSFRGSSAWKWTYKVLSGDARRAKVWANPRIFPVFLLSKISIFFSHQKPATRCELKSFSSFAVWRFGMLSFGPLSFFDAKNRNGWRRQTIRTVQSTPVSALNECLKDFMSNFLPGGIPPNSCTTIFSKDAEFSCVLGCHFTSWTFVCVCVCVHFRSHATSVTLGVRTFIWHLNDIWKWEVFFTSLNVFVFAWLVFVFGCRWHAEQNRPAINFKPKTPNTQRYHRGRLRWLGCRCFGAGCVRKTAHCTSY